MSYNNNNELNVLIIEDSYADALILKRLLEQNFSIFKLTLCSEWKKWKEFTSKHSFDIFFVDLYFDDQQRRGIDIIRSLRLEYPNAIIVATSNDDSVSSVLQSFDAGANDFIRKTDFNQDTLRFYTIITKIISQATVKKNILTLINNVLQSKEVFLIKFTMDNVKGIIPSWTDYDKPLSDDFILFGIKALTTLVGEQETWGEFPVANTMYRAVGYGYHVNKPIPRLQTIVNEAIFVFYPSKIHRFISDISNFISYLKKIKDETDNEKIQQLKKEMFLRNIKIIT